MTTKTEPGSAAPDSDTAPALRGGTPSRELAPEEEDRLRVGGLPSIIVDPAAYAAAAAPQRDDEQISDALQTEGMSHEAPSETQIAAPPATHHNGASAELDEPTPAGSGDTAPGLGAAPSTTMSETAQSDAELPPEDRLTVEDAERFAESFRPSWHSLPAVTPSPLPNAVVPVPSAEASDEPIESVLPRSQQRRSLALVAGAVIVFAGLIAMAMNSAHTPEPGAKAKPSVAAKAPAAQPVKAAPVAPPPAAPAAAAPAALAQPALPTAAPTPAAPTATGAETTPTEATAVPAAQPELTQPPGTAVAAATPEPAAAAPAAPGTTAVPAVQPEPAAPAAAPAEPTTVRIQLQTTPDTATLLIDGATVGNPYDQTLPKSGKHRVRVEAPGYRESEITLNFDRDRDLSVRLQRLRGRAARRTAPAASAPARAAAPTAPPPPVLSIKPAAPAKPAKAAPAKTPPKGAGFVSESPY